MSFQLVLACKCLRVLYDEYPLTADALAGRVNKGPHASATTHEIGSILRVLRVHGIVDAKIKSMRSPAKWELSDLFSKKKS